MNRLGNCAPCAAGNPVSIPFLGRYPYKANSGIGDWYSELKMTLKPMAPWIISAALISGLVGFKLGKWYCAGIFLEREARVASGTPARKRRRKK